MTSKSWTLNPYHRSVFTLEGCTDLGNWRDEHGIVHVLAEHETTNETYDGDGHKYTDGYRWWETPCDIRFDRERGGTAVYTKDPVTCVLCLEHA